MEPVYSAGIRGMMVTHIFRPEAASADEAMGMGEGQGHGLVVSGKIGAVSQNKQMY